MHERLSEAERTMRSGQILTDLPDALLAKAQLLASLQSWRSPGGCE